MMSESDRQLRVVVADDAVLLRDGIARLLQDAGFEVLATVGDADALLEHVRRDPPDLVILDIRMPPTHTTEGLRAALAVREFDPSIAIVVLSQYVEPRYAVDLLRQSTGGIGYLLKDRITDSTSFLDAVHHITAGGSVIDPEVVTQLLNRRRSSSALEALTDREHEVLHLMAEGRSNSAIAEQLHISIKTLEKHIASILQKLDLSLEPDVHRRVLAVVTYLRQMS